MLFFFTVTGFVLLKTFINLTITAITAIIMIVVIIFSLNQYTAKVRIIEAGSIT